MIPFIDLAAQQKRIRHEVSSGIARVLAHGQYILGPEVDLLEERLRACTGSRHCITCANGTDALQIALMALGIGPGDEVVVPAFTYVAPAEAAVLLGAKPVYVDIEPSTFNIDPTLIEERLTPRTKAIVAVSLYGQPANLETVNAVAGAHGVPVIEDAAQSFGAVHGGRPSCALSTLGCTSFFPSKPLGCYGDGGAVFTDDDELAMRIRQIARHGQDRRYHHVRVGVNSRLDTLQAAVLLAKLQVFPEELAARHALAGRYAEALDDLEGLALPVLASGNTSSWAQYTVRLGNRSAVRDALTEAGIPTAVHYPMPLYRQPALADPSVFCPQSERAAAEVASLPLHAYLRPEAQDAIIDAIRRVSAAGVRA